jgi:DNA-binding MarR family transcriptional regulator
VVRDNHGYGQVSGDSMTAKAQSDAVRVWFRLIRLETRIRLAIAARLKEINISVPQCDVLTTLTEEEGLNQQVLAERLYVTKGNISGLLDRLAEAGLVERRAIEGDRRSFAIYLTPEGRRVAKQGIRIQADFVNATLGQISPAKLGEFEALLIQARDLVREMPESHSAPPARKAKTGKKISQI